MVTTSCKYVQQKDPMHYKLRQFCNQSDGTYEETFNIRIGSGKPWQFDVQIRTKAHRKALGKNVWAVQFDDDPVKKHTTLWWMGMVSAVRMCNYKWHSLFICFRWKFIVFAGAGNSFLLLYRCVFLLIEYIRFFIRLKGIVFIPAATKIKCNLISLYSLHFEQWNSAINIKSETKSIDNDISQNVQHEKFVLNENDCECHWCDCCCCVVCFENT